LGEGKALDSEAIGKKAESQKSDSYSEKNLKEEKRHKGGKKKIMGGGPRSGKQKFHSLVGVGAEVGGKRVG